MTIEPNCPRPAPGVDTRPPYADTRTEREPRPSWWQRLRVVFGSDAVAWQETSNLEQQPSLIKVAAPNVEDGLIPEDPK